MGGGAKFSKHHDLKSMIIIVIATKTVGSVIRQKKYINYAIGKKH